MGIVTEFEQSGDPAWDVSRNNFHAADLFTELADHADIVFVASRSTLMLYNKNHLKIKVVANEAGKT